MSYRLNLTFELPGGGGGGGGSARAGPFGGSQPQHGRRRTPLHAHRVPPLATHHPASRGGSRGGNRHRHPHATDPSATSVEDDLAALSGASKPFRHWERQRQAEEELASFYGRPASPDFDLDFTSEPGPLSGGGWPPPVRQPANIGTSRRPAAAPGDTFPRPQAGDWERRLAEELERERQVEEAEEEVEREQGLRRERARADLDRDLAAAQAAAEGVTPPPQHFWGPGGARRRQQQQQQQRAPTGSRDGGSHEGGRRQQQGAAGPASARPGGSGSGGGGARLSKEEMEAEGERLKQEGERLLKEAQARQAKAKADAAARVGWEAAAKAARERAEAAAAAAVAGHQRAWQQFEDRFAGSEGVAIRLAEVTFSHRHCPTLQLRLLPPPPSLTAAEPPFRVGLQLPRLFAGSVSAGPCEPAVPRAGGDGRGAQGGAAQGVAPLAPRQVPWQVRAAGQRGRAGGGGGQGHRRLPGHQRAAREDWLSRAARECSLLKNGRE